MEKTFFIEPVIVEKPAVRVIGLVARGRPDTMDYGALWDEVGMREDEVLDIAAGDTGFGVMWNFDEATGALDYLAALRLLDDDALVPEGWHVWTIPAGTYAEFPCTLQTLPAAFQFIYGQWLPRQRDFRRTDGPEYEYYGKEFHPEIADSPMAVLIPVRSAD